MDVFNGCYNVVLKQPSTYNCHNSHSIHAIPTHSMLKMDFRSK